MNEQNHSSRLALLVAVLLVIIVGSLLLWKASAHKPTEEIPNIVASDRSASHEEDEIFYFVSAKVSDADFRTVYELYRLNLNIGEQDQKILSLEPGYTHPQASGRPGVLFSTKNQKTLVAIELPSGATKDLVSAPEGKIISGGGRFVGDNEVAYITAEYNPSDPRAENSELHIFDTAREREVKRLLVSAVSPIYSGVFVLGGSMARNKIYLSESGGDGGAGWSTTHLADLNQGRVTKLFSGSSSEEGSSGEFLGTIDPSGTKALMVKPSAPYDPADLGADGCLRYDSQANASALFDKYANYTQTLWVRNLDDHTSREVYRELGNGSRNFCQKYIRQIFGAHWLDSRQVLLTNADVVMKFNIETGDRTTVYRFPQWITPSTINRPAAVFLRGNLLGFSDGTIIDLKTNKKLTLESGLKQPTRSFYHLVTD